ncbi:MAG: NAD(P)-dependent oxidoreductase [Crocinitomicaceae bacterium]
MKKVGFIDTVHPILEHGLEELGIDCIDLTSFSKEKIISERENFWGFVVRSRFSLDYEFLRSFKNLEFIARSGAGLENIDINYCISANITLFNAPEGNRNAVAEHGIGMLLALFNKLCSAQSEVRAGEWNREANRGIELEGKTVGIIGYGNNGSKFAQKLKSFDVNILAYDKYKSDFGNDFVKEVQMAEIYKKCDILSLHIPQNDETTFLVDSDFIQQFKKPFYLVNLARGKIVETSAIVKALKCGVILGACLDVLEYEKASFEDMFSADSFVPDDFKYLINSSKVILSPHVAGWTHESYYKLSSVLLAKIKHEYNL